MKRLPIPLLGLSLVANAALVWKVAASKPADSVPLVASAKLESSTATAASSGSAAASSDPGTLADLRRAPIPQLVAHLRAAGFDDAFITAIVHQRLRAERQAELAALDDGAEMKGVWWRTANSNSPERKARQAKRSEINAQIQADVNAALGLTAKAASADPRFAFLSEDKIAAVKQIEKEFQAVAAAAEKGGQTSETRSTIESEKKADLAAILTPQELAEYELRFSSTANEMRSRASFIEATEAEYRTLFKIQQAHDIAYPRGASRAPADYSSRETAAVQLREQIIAALGAERGGDYVWGQNGDYQNIKQASALAGLPSTTALNVVSLREEIGAQGLAIARNRQFSETEKFAALTALATTAQQRLDALLPATAQAQVPPRSLSWVTDLAKGRVTITDPLRSSSSSHQIHVPGAPRG